METTTHTLPAWIGTTQPTTTEQTQSNYAILMERQLSIYESIWEQILDRTSLGHRLKDIVSDDPREIDLAKLNRWITKDPKRAKEYREAKKMGAHMVLEEMLDISDAKDSMEDVARSTLRVNTRRLYIKAYDKDTFGDNPGMNDQALAGGITINIGAVESPYGKRIDTIDIQPTEPTLLETPDE